MTTNGGSGKTANRSVPVSRNDFKDIPIRLAEIAEIAPQQARTLATLICEYGDWLLKYEKETSRRDG